MLLRSMRKYTKELADAQAENDALRDDVAAGRRRLHIISSLLGQCVKLPTASGVDNAASPDWQTITNGIISPSERLITMQKQSKEPRSILTIVDRAAYIDGNSCNYCEQLHTRFQRSINT